MSQDVDDALISKKILYMGRKYIPFHDGTKVHFHFQTKLPNADGTIIDDSRKMGTGKPVELILGKKFKLQAWEVIIQKMAVGEVAQFTVDKSLVVQYPFVSKTLRDASNAPNKARSHCCAMTMQAEGIGYSDLNDMMKNPCNLEFTIELLKIEHEQEYKKEAWQMTDEEKLNLVQKLQDDGNEKFRQKLHKEAGELYAEAIGYLEQLIIKEKPNDVEWTQLNKRKLPLLLNYSQCKLLEGDFYAVIEHCTTVLQFETDNVKALFKRGKAHVGAWNPDKAKEDFNRVMALDQSLTVLVTKELNLLNKQVAVKAQQDKEKLKSMFKG